MNPVGWFEIAVEDMERAIAFYEKTFQMSLKRHDMDGTDMAWFPVEEGAAYGATGTLIACEGAVPGASAITIYLSVEDIDDVLARLPEAAILHPKTSIGEFGIYAHIQDSEGNRIGIHSHG
ncbi:VOC family protein [Enterovibrio sp. ZSDZ35]|uniref:VOC family protein n=1 Tax=Enterovibrio qingdaonensis TaxID=2899818 RepID=A0ABT5QS03_9GAMM|nr:VOC family protein [Enterovibrio sp. ZSDZ35]MDD1783679.1 VOC family protein [Enterovibrio sp. ZSDZ35]